MKCPDCKKEVSRSKEYCQFCSGLLLKTRDPYLPNWLAELDILKNMRD